MDMMNAVKSVQPTHSLRRSAYPHQPYVDTLNVLPPRRRRPKLVLTGTSIPLILRSFKEYLSRTLEPKLLVIQPQTGHSLVIHFAQTVFLNTFIRKVVFQYCVNPSWTQSAATKDPVDQLDAYITR